MNNNECILWDCHPGQFDTGYLSLISLDARQSAGHFISRNLKIRYAVSSHSTPGHKLVNKNN